MAEEKFTKAQQTKVAKETKDKKQQGMLVHEHNELTQQGKLNKKFCATLSGDQDYQCGTRRERR